MPAISVLSQIWRDACAHCPIAARMLCSHAGGMRPNPCGLRDSARAGGEGRSRMSLAKRQMPVRSAAGFLVHVLTASGGAVALLALYAAIERDFTTTFAW